MDHTLFPNSLQSIKHLEYDSLCIGLLSKIRNRDYLFFIHRSFEVPTHKNQLAFVGGHAKHKESALETAQREYEEELNLPWEDLNFLGVSHTVKTRNNKVMLPIFATIDYSKFKNIQSNGEWDYCFWYPLDRLREKNTWRYFYSQRQNSKVPVLMRNIDFSHAENFYSTNGHKSQSFILWGATARVVWDFIKFKN